MRLPASGTKDLKLFYIANPVPIIAAAAWVGRGTRAADYHPVETQTSAAYNGACALQVAPPRTGPARRRPCRCATEAPRMRRTVLLPSLLIVGLACPGSVGAQPAKPVTLKVWPGPAPGEVGNVGEEKVLDDKPGQSKVKRITNVTRPTLTV